MKRSFTSLSGQLSFSVLGWVCSFWIASTLAAGWYLHTEMAEGFDSALAESAVRLLELATHELAETRIHPEIVIRGVADRNDRNDRSGAVSAPDASAPGIGDTHTIYQLRDADGQVLMKSENAPAQGLVAPLTNGFSETSQWRVYTLAHPDKPLFMQVADPIRHRVETRNESLGFLWLPLLAILPLLGFLVHRTVRIRLTPVASLSEQLRERGGKNLAPVSDQGLPDELVSMVDSVNQLLSRLQDALQTERALSANAAHELRTPLAVAQLRLANALALEQSDAAREEVNFANDALVKLSRRTEKLLQLSRAESGAGLARNSVCLQQVALAVLQEFETVRTPIHLLADVSSQSVQVEGDFDSIAIALRNLIENSVRYGQGSAVEIEINAPGEVVVRDSGPGVSASLLGDLATRHVRHSTNAAGFGLGLSIVKTIVERHGGELRFASPPAGQTAGLEVRMCFFSAAFRKA